METIISVENLTFSYENADIPVIKNISFSLEKGSYTALAGVNGSGKSTVAKIIAGLLFPSSGKINFSRELKIGIVFQSPKDQIICGVVSRDTEFGPHCQNLSDSETELRTIESLKATNMLDFAMQSSMTLSLGQTQKIALSGILAINPDILILDEATSMLDPKSREEIFSFLSKLNSKEITILHITHDLHAIKQTRRTIVMNKGEINWQGKTNDFLSETNKLLFKTVFGNPLEKSDKKIEKTEIALKLQDVSFSYNEKDTIKNISFSLQKGSLNALTGPSGSGKSTTLELIAGLLNKKTGVIKAIERPLLCQQNSDSAIFESFAADDVAFGPKNMGLHGNHLISVVKDSMNQVNLPFEQYASKQTCCLSGGEKRRLSIAGIIATGSNILLFDEPTAGLDGISKNKILHLLRTLADNGKTVLFTTHHIDEAQFADRNIIIENGNITSFLEDNNIKDSDNNLDEQKTIENSKLIENFSKIINTKQENEDNILYKLPSVLKFIIFLSLFITSLSFSSIKINLLFLSISFLYALLSNFSKKTLFSSMIKIIPFLLLFFIFQIIFSPVAQNDKIYISFRYFTISLSKLLMCCKILLHTESALCCICAFTSTSTENDILKTFSIILNPLKLLHINVKYPLILIEIIFRFIPLLIDESINIIKTQLVRGGLGRSKGFFKKIYTLIPLIVPLIIQTIKRAEKLADAMTVRGLK